MKMTHHDREYLLSQIAAVLSDLQRLVSQLSTVQIEEKEVSKVKILCQKITAPSLNLMPNDVLHKLAFDCDLSSTDDDVSSVSSQQSSKFSWDMNEDYPVSPTSERFSPEMKCPTVRNSIPEEECSFVNKVKCFISSNFPNHVYSKQKSTQIRQEWLDEGVLNEFQSMWRSAIVGDLFGQNPEANQSCTTPPPPPVIRYNTIDFTKVNVRSIANIPRPEHQAVHGCSQDPKFYSESVILSYDYYNRPHTLESSHKKAKPFGSLYGYLTNVGVVPVPDTPVHGYIWCHDSGGFILHAMDPIASSTAPPRTPWTRTRGSTTRRPPSTRKRWPP